MIASLSNCFVCLLHVGWCRGAWCWWVPGWFGLWSLEAQLDGSHVVWSCLSLLGAVYLCWVLFIAIGRSLVGAGAVLVFISV